MATAILIGAGVTILALTSKSIIKSLKSNPALGFNSSTLGSSKYARGGFEIKMSTTEATAILGLKSNYKLDGLKRQHRAIMLANHPDRGGSPYIAAKINEARDLLQLSNKS